MKRLIAVVAAVSLLLIGCGDDSDSGATQTDSGATQTGSGATQTDSGATDNTAAPESDTAGSDDAQADTATDDEVSDLLDGLDFGNGAARVTVGDVEFEFALGGNETAEGTTFIGSCQELFGLIVGGGFVPGDPDTTIDFEIPPPDWESYDDGRFDSSEPRIEIELGDDGGWAADLTFATNRPELVGQSQIDEWTLDDGVAVGTATFIEMEPWSSPVEGATPVQGSFEIGCAAR